jgi:hypothetical protein
MMRGRIGRNQPRLEDDRARVEVEDILWELSEKNGFHSGFRLDFFDSQLRKALEGNTRPLQVGFWSPRSGGPPVRILCENFEFSSGSLKTYVNGFVSGTAFMITLLVSVGATPIGEEAHKLWVINQVISSVYAGEECLTNTQFQFSAADLIDMNAGQFDWTLPNLTDAEKHRRVCLLQATIDWDGHSPGAIDGEFGGDTCRAFDAFLTAHHLGNRDVSDVDVRRALARALLSSLREMAK